jgi:hypothetical protein
MRADAGSADQRRIFLGKLLMDPAGRFGLRILGSGALGLLTPAKVVHPAFIDHLPALSISGLSAIAFE